MNCEYWSFKTGSHLKRLSRFKNRFNAISLESPSLLITCSLKGSPTTNLPWDVRETLSRKCCSQRASSSVRLFHSFMTFSCFQKSSNCSCNCALDTFAWKAWTRWTELDERSRRPARIHPSRVFCRSGCLVEALICPTHRMSQNNSAPIRTLTSRELWN